MTKLERVSIEEITGVEKTSNDRELTFVNVSTEGSRLQGGSGREGGCLQLRKSKCARQTRNFEDRGRRFVIVQSGLADDGKFEQWGGKTEEGVAVESGRGELIPS